ncbi:hypothetical protein EC988_008816, partial [Linderina pennispora]
GYVDGTRPGYQLAALAGGRWAALRAVVRQPTEGVLSLFKGSFTQWAYDMLHLLLQPTLEGAMNELLGLYDSAALGAYIDAGAPSALTLVASHVIVGWLLAPLEVVRTRLAVQSASPVHRKYRGTLHALRTAAREEGGLVGLYVRAAHVTATLVKHALDPVFRSMGAFVLGRAGIDAYDHPTSFALGGLAWKTLAAVVMLPIDTVRTRLMAQPKYERRQDGFREFRTCVARSPVPYTGMANCAWRIVSEEGESLPSLQRRRAAMARARAAGDADKAERLGRVGHFGLRGL